MRRQVQDSNIAQVNMWKKHRVLMTVISIYVNNSAHVNEIENSNQPYFIRKNVV